MLLFLLIVLTCTGVEDVFGQNCESKQTCGQCIQELGCFWCNAAVNTSHCLPTNQESQCATKNKQKPAGFFEIVSDVSLSESKQIKPQHIRLKLRKNEKSTIRFKYQQTENYPIDLYYIMDLSYSMIKSKQQLARLGQELAAEMIKKTNDFRIGFGSYVDKLALPYVNTLKLNQPCADISANCAPPYSFKNHLSLTNDAKSFSRRVNETRISANMDTPEGGFDALMQAMVCNKVIGWRPNARHLLVLSTDAVSHIAGDGKLGGVIEPNDAQCHMENDTYTKDLVYDYPSISQINYVARQNNINIIFAIESKEKIEIENHYRSISAAIENSKMGTLSDNSKNVVKFISEIYDKIRDGVKITSHATKDIDVKLTSTCPGFIDGSCSNIKPGQIIDFTVTIQPRECNIKGNNKKTIYVKPEGLEDSLAIELEVICDCDCAQFRNISSSNCDQHGDLECGVCICQEDWFGENCQCGRTADGTEDMSLCIKPDGRNEICSGQGKCICGKCKCKARPNENEHITGKYCDCDDYSCPLKCSGRGKCECGKCSCDSGWTGPGCECSTDVSHCIEPGSDKICSGYGECVCGQCQCKDDTEKHSGTYCESCTSCPAQRCDEFKDCILYRVHGRNVYGNSTEKLEECGDLNITAVAEINEKWQDDVKRCTFVVEDDCTIQFEYSYVGKSLVLKAENKKTCPEPPNILGWIIGIVTSTILAGILTLIIWKVLTTLHDKREYAKFEQERQKLQWHRHENPLYNPATTTFSNPQYTKGNKRVSVRFTKGEDGPSKDNGKC
ncbi:integrin beta-PS-like [Rhynchophorus ferrugineus]|uniref:Integrin beta n=1 Tax=Rhynchophorus ferrugineus TaxID=354439 RepID=A0A834HZJ0_RHYFE|nr:hypothetical protein GWI33_017155 [Rhynchophorus ferrugineus]